MGRPPSSLHRLKAAPLCVFSERSARRARAPGAPGTAGSAWIRRHRRESLTWNRRGRERRTKANFVSLGAGWWRWCLEMQCPLSPVGGADPHHKEPVCSAKTSNQRGDGEPVIAAHRQGAAVLSAHHIAQRFLILLPSSPFFLEWETT